MDHLDTMRAFAAVAACESFAEAARRLRWSPSAVTRAVAALERHLGQVLLSRTTRSVQLTPAGETYLGDCRAILDGLEAAERRVRGEDAEPRGLLTVAAPLSFGRLHVLPVVHDLLAAHPGLSVRLVLSDRFARLVDEGVDVAIRIADLEDSGLVAVRLAKVRRVCVASPAYLAARGEPATPAELPGHDVVGHENVEGGEGWLFGHGRPVRVRPRLLVNTVDAALAAAERGLGITRALSYQVADAVRDGRLRLLPDAFSSTPVPVNAVHHARRGTTHNIAAFLRVARAHMKATPPFAG